MAEHAEVREGKGEIVTKDAAGMQAWGEEVCEAVASTMAEARLALHHGSAAEDRDVDEAREHLFTKILNTTAQLQEYSTEQAAAACLGQPISFSSDSTTPVFGHSAARALRARAAAAWQRRCPVVLARARAGRRGPGSGRPGAGLPLFLCDAPAELFRAVACWL